MGIRKEVRLFSDAMEHKLRLKDHKGGWHNMPLDQLFKLLIDEVKELEEAVTEGNTFDIMAESADVGNYAMMIMDNAIRRITNDETKTEVRSEEGPSAAGNVSGCAVCGEVHGCGHNFVEYHGRQPNDATELGVFWQRTGKPSANARSEEDRDPVNFPTESGDEPQCSSDPNDPNYCPF